MGTTKVFCWSIFALGLMLIAVPVRLSSQQNRTSVRIDSDDIGGLVVSTNGAEAGVWVIAETSDLPTKYAKIVVTDDQGRYVIPDLPKANYNIWVRGYGLVDSPKIRATPGKILNLKAVVAPNESAAAEYYPAIYWYSMLKIPEKSEFPLGKARSQAHWLAGVKTHGCISCHQLGNKPTRTMHKEFSGFKSSLEAWQRRVLSGQASEVMMRNLDDVEPKRALELFADWTDRIAAGEL